MDIIAVLANFEARLEADGRSGAPASGRTTERAIMDLLTSAEDSAVSTGVVRVNR